MKNLAANNRPPQSSVANPDPNFDDRRLNLAIIGCGPRGLRVLDCLLSEYERVGSREPLEITIFEPAPSPGAGCVYDPKQPRFFRMNFSADRITALPRGDNSRVRDAWRQSFPEWARENLPALDSQHAYPSRAAVGAYLNDCFVRLLARIPSQWSVSILRQRVEDLDVRDDGVRVLVAGMWNHYDHAVLTTGHGGFPSSSAANETTASVFPIMGLLTKTPQLAKQAVAIKGLGLTAIDAILALTEGVGGAFTREHQSWRYRPTGGEPRRIAPYSRSGLPPLCKPDPTVGLAPDEAAAIAQTWAQHLRLLCPHRGEGAFANQVWSIVARCADELLACGLGLSPRVVQGAARRWFRDWRVSGAALPAGWMQSSYLVATGLKRLDAGWALGESWRQLHAPLAAIVNYGQLSTVAVSGFQLLLGELERVGFGPAAENVGRLLGLLDARILDLSFACAPRLDSLPNGYRLSSVGASLNVPLLIDAVLPTPPRNARSGLIGQLVRRGALALDEPTRTVKVDRAGRPLGATAAARQRLALFGRCTEGWILGNDTLNLAPHEQPQNWARTLLAPLGANKVL